MAEARQKQVEADRLKQQADAVRQQNQEAERKRREAEARRQPGGSERSGPAAGYVFICDNATEPECRSIRCFGAAAEDLALMQRVITVETEIFLFNWETRRLMGAFRPSSPVTQHLMPAAFGGRLPAQIRVEPAQSVVAQAVLDLDLRVGAKRANEVDTMRGKLGLSVRPQARSAPRAVAGAGSLEDRVRSLKAEKDRAVEEENYERAGELKREIIALEEEAAARAEQANLDAQAALDPTAPLLLRWNALNSEKVEAVEEEDYARAAAIKDEMKALKEQIDAHTLGKHEEKHRRRAKEEEREAQRQTMQRAAAERAAEEERAQAAERKAESDRLVSRELEAVAARRAAHEAFKRSKQPLPAAATGLERLEAAAQRNAQGLASMEEQQVLAMETASAVAAPLSGYGKMSFREKLSLLLGEQGSIIASRLPILYHQRFGAPLPIPPGEKLKDLLHEAIQAGECHLEEECVGKLWIHSGPGASHGGGGYPPKAAYAGPVSESGEDPDRIIVKNIPPQTTREGLRQLFEAYGSVKDVYIPKKPDTIAFIQFDVPETTDKVLAQRGRHSYEGVALSVMRAERKTATTTGGFAAKGGRGAESISSSASISTQPWFYRTNPCKYGDGCKYGSKCQYWHTESERREPDFKLRALQDAAGMFKGGGGKGKGGGGGVVGYPPAASLPREDVREAPWEKPVYMMSAGSFPARYTPQGPGSDSSGGEPVQHVVVLVGAPGSGKSHTADMIMNMGIEAGASWRIVNQDTLKSRQACEAECREALGQGEHLIVDRCNFDRKQRSTWLAIAKNSSQHCCLSALCFELDLDVCMARVESRDDHPTLSGPRSETDRIVDGIFSRLTCPGQTEGFDRIVWLRDDTDMLMEVSALSYTTWLEVPKQAVSLSATEADDGFKAAAERMGHDVELAKKMQQEENSAGWNASAEQAASGFVVYCNNETEQDCKDLKLFGGPFGEFAAMKEAIGPNTQLYLFNFQARVLTGAFLPQGKPGMNLVKGAFGGRFPAQVRIAPLEPGVQSIKIEKSIASGRRDGPETSILRQQLHLEASHLGAAPLEDALATQRAAERILRRRAEEAERAEQISKYGKEDDEEHTLRLKLALEEKEREQKRLATEQEAADEKMARQYQHHEQAFWKKQEQHAKEIRDFKAAVAKKSKAKESKGADRQKNLFAALGGESESEDSESTLSEKEEKEEEEDKNKPERLAQGLPFDPNFKFDDKPNFDFKFDDKPAGQKNPFSSLVFQEEEADNKGSHHDPCTKTPPQDNSKAVVDDLPIVKQGWDPETNLWHSTEAGYEGYLHGFLFEKAGKIKFTRQRGWFGDAADASSMVMRGAIDEIQERTGADWFHGVNSNDMRMTLTYGIVFMQPRVMDYVLRNVKIHAPKDHKGWAKWTISQCFLNMKPQLRNEPSGQGSMLDYAMQKCFQEGFDANEAAISQTSNLNKLFQIDMEIRSDEWAAPGFMLLSRCMRQRKRLIAGPWRCMRS